MREILFRGKRTDNKEWVEGNLFFNHDDRVFIGELIVNDYKGTAADRYEIGTDIVEVDPATVGQYTGLCDNTKWEDLTDTEKSDFYRQHYIGEDGMSVRFQHIDDVRYLWKGKKIFEGDIVKIDGYEKVYEVKYMLGQFFVGIHMPIAYKRFDCKIIGNIHDNPELLEVDNG